MLRTPCRDDAVPLPAGRSRGAGGTRHHRHRQDRKWKDGGLRVADARAHHGPGGWSRDLVVRATSAHVVRPAGPIREEVLFAKAAAMGMLTRVLGAHNSSSPSGVREGKIILRTSQMSLSKNSDVHTNFSSREWSGLEQIYSQISGSSFLGRFVRRWFEH